MYVCMYVCMHVLCERMNWFSMVSQSITKRYPLTIMPLSTKRKHSFQLSLTVRLLGNHIRQETTDAPQNES